MSRGLLARAFAPFDVFGGVFHGDDRGATTRSDVTSRIKAWVVFEPLSGKTEAIHAMSDRSSWILTGDSAVGAPTAKILSTRRGADYVHMSLHIRGANPMTPPGTPDIDMWITMTASVRSSHLDVNATLSGDQFPNTELMLQDQKGRRRMLMAFETNADKHTGPLTRPPGANHRPMNAICKAFAIDPKGSVPMIRFVVPAIEAGTRRAAAIRVVLGALVVPFALLTAVAWLGGGNLLGLLVLACASALAWFTLAHGAAMLGAKGRAMERPRFVLLLLATAAPVVYYIAWLACSRTR